MGILTSKKLFYFLPFLLFSLFAQNCDKAFVEYLSEQRMFDLLMQIETDSCPDDLKREINFIKCLEKFKRNPKDKTILDFELDSTASKHQSMKAIVLFLNDSWEKRKNEFMTFEDTSFFKVVSITEAIQKNDFARSNAIAQTLDSTALHNKVFIKKMDRATQEFQKKNKRSLARAMLASAIIPGLGKKYYGKSGETVYLMISNGVFAGLLTEAILRKGLFSVFSITYAGAFLTFYGGNLVGTYNAYRRTELAKKRKLKNETNEALIGWYLANYE